MKSKFTWVITLCMALFIQISFAQEKTISGTVVNKADKMTMPGVNILVKGTKRGTQTDFNGEFTIKASVGEKLEISSLGSKTQTITVGTSNKLSIEMEDDVAKLEEVVVEGYNVTRTKEKSNIASATIGSKTIEARPNANFLQTLQGQVAGVNVSTNSGQPGANSYLVIRGSGSINGEDEPIYVVDGTPMASDNFRSLNPDEFESVSVLKDAGATAIYGNRGANGIIVVKTKRGSYDSALGIRYISNTGFTKLQDHKFHLMNSQQLLTFERDFGSGFGAVNSPSRTPFEIANSIPKAYSDEEIAAAENYDWRDTFFRTGITQNHTLSLTSGSKNLASATTLGYFEQEGTLQNTGLQRFNFRSNINGKSADDRFNYGTNLSVNFSRNNSASTTSGAAVNQNVILGAIKGVPYLTPSAYENGQQLEDLFRGYTIGNGLVYAPLMLIDKQNTFRQQTEELKGVGNLMASYKFTKKLTFDTNFGIDYTQANGYTFTHPDSFNELYFQSPEMEPLGLQNESFTRTTQFNWVNKLNYHTKFGEKHSLDATLFTEYSKAYTKSLGYKHEGMNPRQATPGTGAGFITDDPSSPVNFDAGSSGYASTGLFSYFGTLDYDYDSRYGVGLTLRRDASSRFATTNRWGTFYSVTGRWNISRESFMQGSIFDVLKLRGSFGTNGNQLIAGTLFDGLNDTRDLYGNVNGYGTTTGVGITQVGIDDLKWETSEQADLGLDFEVFNRRLRGTFDVYKKTTKDIYQRVPISLVNGFDSLDKNYGSLYNQGVELQLNYDVVKSMDGFNFTLKFNGAYNESQIVDIANPEGLIDNGNTAQAEGHANNEFYVIRYIGVNPANGNLLFKDKDGNPTENPTLEDRVLSGKTTLPKYQGSFGFDASYKGFYLNTQFYYVADSWRYDFDLANVQDAISSTGISSLSTDLYRAWTVDNRYTDIPALRYTNGTMEQDSDRYLRDASYTRLKLVKFGYDFPKKMLAKSPFKALQIYAQGENLLTWAKWRGLDVENSSGATQNNYPTSKIFSMGLQLEF